MSAVLAIAPELVSQALDELDRCGLLGAASGFGSALVSRRAAAKRIAHVGAARLGAR
jgi:hypothetical protein